MTVETSDTTEESASTAEQVDCATGGPLTRVQATPAPLMRVPATPQIIPDQHPHVIPI